MPTKLVILEGPDRCGKSTMAQKLSEELGCQIYHFGKPDPALQAKFGPQYQYTNLVNEWASQPYVILDRSWVSGLFYDIHRRQRVRSSIEGELMFIEILLNQKKITPYLFCAYRTWDKSLESDHIKELQEHTNPVPASLRERLIEHYSWPGFVQQFKFPHLTSFFNVTQTSPSELLQYVNANVTPETAIHELDSVPYRQATVSRFFGFWHAQNWKNPDYAGIGELFGSLPYGY
jgi:hypothetical protein